MSADAYYYDAVLWAVEEGITSGVTGTTFAPDASCTRAQAAVMLWRAEGSPAVSGANPFRDVADDDYYADAVVWAVKNCVTQGTTASTFDPGEACTRAQFVTFLYRALGRAPRMCGAPFFRFLPGCHTMSSSCRRSRIS